MVDQRLIPAAALAGGGEVEDGSLMAAELEALLRSLPQGKEVSGLDGIPFELYLHFWEVLGSSLPCSRRSSSAQAALRSRLACSRPASPSSTCGRVLSAPCLPAVLDFEEALDRVDRPCIERCMSAVGFQAGPAAVRPHRARGHISHLA